jgi:hypothetical protein
MRIQISDMAFSKSTCSDAPCYFFALTNTLIIMDTKTTIYLQRGLVAILFLFFHTKTAIYAQAPQKPSSVFEHLTTIEGGLLELEIDLTEIINNKNTNTYFPGHVKVNNEKTFRVEVRPRGKYRRRICDVPPLKLKFSKKELRASALDTFNEVKIVTPCEFTPEGEALLMKEYLAYRAYEKIDPTYSVRARLVKIKFKDKHVEVQRPAAFCILLEHEEELTGRLGGSIVEAYNLKMDSMDMSKTSLTVMFEYMIGNTDWDLSSFRNVYLFKPNKGGKLMPIPYDFDFSGLVNAPYAVPTSESGLRKVQDRYLMARDIPSSFLRQAVQTIKSNKLEIGAICTAAYLPDNVSKEVMRYLNTFFEAVESKEDVPEKMKVSMR